MWKKGLTCLALVLAAAVGPAMAEEIVYFTNGTSMPVRGHEIDQDMIKVDLGGDAFMAFPRDQVDRIEQADGNVNLLPSTRGNIMNPTPTSRFTGTPTRDRSKNLRVDPQSGEQIKIEPDAKGVASYAPFANSGHAGKAKLRIGGNTLVTQRKAARTNAEGLAGASRRGVGMSLPGKDGVPKKTLRGITKQDD